MKSIVYKEIGVNPHEILKEFHGWDVQEDGNGFFIYRKDGFAGCIRQNSVNGTTEVFLSSVRDVIADPNRDDAMYVEYGLPASDGREEFARAILAVDVLSIGEEDCHD